MRGRLGNTSALGIIRELQTVCWICSLHPSTTQAFEAAHLWGSNSTGPKYSWFNYLWRTAEGQGGSEWLHIKEGKGESASFPHLKFWLEIQDWTVLLNWVVPGHTLKQVRFSFSTGLPLWFQPNFPFTCLKTKGSITPWSLGASRFHNAWNLDLDL